MSLLDVVSLFVLLPVFVELVHLAGDVALLLEVERLVDLAEAALAQEHQQQVAIVEHRMVIEPRLVLVVDPLELAYVQIPLALQLLHLQLQVGVFLLQRALS